MSGSAILQVIGSIMSLSLLTTGVPPGQQLAVGSHGTESSDIQALLGILGYNPGPVTGTMNQKTLNAADVFVTDFGAHSTLDAQLQKTLTGMATWSTSTHGAAVLAVQDQLRGFHLYDGPLDGTWSPALTSAFKAFCRDAGVSAKGAVTGKALVELAHLTSVRLDHQHRWSYRAESGDTMSRLAWATGMSLSRFQAANPAHGKILWKGQQVRWTPAAPTSKAPHSSPAPAPTSTPPSSTPSGVLANLNPVAALVVIEPSAAEVANILKGEATQKHMFIDVSVTGEWALSHQDLVKALAQHGNEVDLAGYTGTNLNRLPKWGVRQELTWGSRVLASELGSAPTFAVFPWTPTTATKKLLDQANLVDMSPHTTLTAPSTATLTTTLLKNENQVVAMTGSDAVRWSALASELKGKHFVFENLGQIWANQ